MRLENYQIALSSYYHKTKITEAWEGTLTKQYRIFPLTEISVKSENSGGKEG